MKSPANKEKADLEICLFGNFEIYINGKPVNETEIKGRKARSLLKLIAQKRQHQIVRDRAISILWPDLDSASANTQLYKALHHIRKAFSGHADKAADWLKISDNLIRLSPPGGLVTDLTKFEQAAKSGLREHDVDKLEQAASLYKGDFLPMDRYSDWAEMPRDHYRQLYLDVLVVLAEVYEKQNKLSEAAELFRIALDKEPALETAHRGLMRIFAKNGHATRGFRQYDVCRKILGEELGISPSAETKQLLDDIREGQYRKKTDTPAKSRSVSEPASPIIGRAKECTDFQKKDRSTGQR